MTTPASNDADKPAANTTSTQASSNKAEANTNTNKGKSTGVTGGLKVRLLARSWQVPVEDERGKVTFLRYSKGDELEVTEETFEALCGPDQFKPAFEKLEADS